MVRHRRRRRRRITPKFLIILILFIAALLMGILAISALVENGKIPADEPQGTGTSGLCDTLFGGSTPEPTPTVTPELTPDAHAHPHSEPNLHRRNKRCGFRA